jgi:hypothetical protein
LKAAATADRMVLSMVGRRAGGWARRKAVLWGDHSVDDPAANLAHLRAGSRVSE